MPTEAGKGVGVVGRAGGRGRHSPFGVFVDRVGAAFTNTVEATEVQVV